MNVDSIRASSITELREQLSNCTFRPTLAIIFASIAIDLEELQNCFREHAIAVFGGTTAGEFVNGEMIDNGLAGLLLDLSPDSFRVIHSTEQGNTTFESAKSLAATAKNLFQKPALIVLSSGVAINADETVRGLKEVLGVDVPIFGGLAGDDLNLEKTYVFSHQAMTTNGLAALVLDNNQVTVKGLATSGWETIGESHIITKSEGNIIYTIDDEPALDVFIKYFGYFDDADLKGKPISTISAQYPLQIIKPDGTTVLRSPLIGNESDKSLVLAGGVQEGEQFHFSISPGFEVIEQTVEEFGRFSAVHPEADALILFSCKGRHAALGPLIEDEISGIYDHWGVPMAGFFSYGEIGNGANGICNFHNETCSLVILKAQ